VHDRSVQVKIDDKGDFSYKVDVSGYRQKDINVELQGNKIMFRGEYKKQNGGKYDIIISWVLSYLCKGRVAKFEAGLLGK
jgi:HSP20 family molecular chaperone IbpA